MLSGGVCLLYSIFEKLLMLVDRRLMRELLLCVESLVESIEE